jgi:putative copper export protein
MGSDALLAIAVMIINFFHDLAVGTLAASVFVIYLMGRYMDQHLARDEILGTIIRRFSYLSYGALAYIIIGGAVRAYFFMDFEWNPAVGRGQVAALVVKHIVLIILTLAGLTAQIRYTKRYGKTE